MNFVFLITFDAKTINGSTCRCTWIKELYKYHTYCVYRIQLVKIKNTASTQQNENNVVFIII